MAFAQTKGGTGRPTIPNRVWNQVVRMKLDGKTPREAIEETGLSQTKVYEIWRNPTIKPDEATQSDAP
jgi:hypothetical protein